MADNNASPSGIDQTDREDDEGELPRPHPSNSRRRTKTGCLTCRRRRIKCGEERPICGNCIKSKRNCEGYNQRVVFKAPMQGPFSSIPSHSGTLPRTNARAPPGQQPLPRSTQNPPLPNILPRRQNQDAVAYPPSAQFQSFINNNLSTFGQGFGSEHRMPHAQGADTYSRRQNLQWQQYQIVDAVPSANSSNGRAESFGSTPPAHRSPSTHMSQEQYNSSDNQSTPQETPPSADDTGNYYWQAASTQPMLQTLSHGGNVMNPRPYLEDEMEEDDVGDPFDVSDDDEDMIDSGGAVALSAGALQRRIAEGNLQAMMALHANQERQDTRVRTYHSVIENFGPDMLATYIPSFRDSPLNDPAAAAIFTHFLNVVAPGISMYERHPANPSLLLQGRPVPKSQQHLWAYTLPTVALRNHALMHAMLALSSLHIAKLQDKPTWVSLKHYHYAIRKLAKNVSLPTRRRQLATLATTLLLGFYEVMSADHSKWCDHLLGSQQLVKHIDFAGMTKFLQQRKRQMAYEKSTLFSTLDDNFDFEGDEPEQSTEEDINEDLVGLLMGKKVNYGEMGEVVEEWDMFENRQTAYTQKDLDLYETQRDLFWWFLKQDTIQSILSQNRLFLNYDRWSHCPPRAPIGRRDAVHGTFDHLVLLLGRLSDFASRDLKRKKCAMGAGIHKPPKKPTAPQAGSVCATNSKNPPAPAPTATSGPPPGWKGGPPPGWQGGPPPGWTGPPPPEIGGIMHEKARVVEAEGCPIAAASAARATQEARAQSMAQRDPPPGWKGPPPPGWTGGPPPEFANSASRQPQGNSGQNAPPQEPPSGFQIGSPLGRNRPPPPGWTGPPPPGFWQPSASSTQSQAGPPPSMPQLPPFAGMLPTGERHLPRGFSPDASSPSASDDSDSCPDGQRIAAEEEWSEIGKAFMVFKSCLGPDFEEMGAEFNPSIDSPFGPAIQYRGYNIAVIWLLYYMGRIVWHRAHPSQMPSAMVAAGMTAQQTGKYANIIGRISAGVAPDARTTTTVAIATGSGLNDTVFALFVAGVQYQDPAQRQWVIQRMLDTERLTGWETATQVAKGLETAWTKAAEMGHGPPYERYVEPAPVNMIWNRATQRMERMFEEAEDKSLPTHHNPHNANMTGRVQWAAGIIGIEVGLKRVNIDSDGEDEDDSGGR